MTRADGGKDPRAEATAIPLGQRESPDPARIELQRAPAELSFDGFLLSASVEPRYRRLKPVGRRGW